ncbi:AAA family ATPase [Acidianus sulfidivorans JP7]|uniref:Uncharacterized protein n=1 Tax=Acidianus sulfidivorans JP7 TaxID=619593 RepID=A0A2U9IJU9_9CREN|nr:AAA family ATPase [Acidianus sulfidivorans]AWR96300.1 AAA family ATPase [Acidianus sulfidivorans JP7]
MKVTKISIIGYKGGVGKTTIAQYITSELIRRNYKAILINENNNPQEKTIYDFYIYDLSEIIEDSLKVFVCNPISIEETFKFSLFVNGEKILIINQISPLPKDIAKIISIANNFVTDFERIFLVPFNGGLFKGKPVKEPVLDLLVDYIVKKNNRMGKEKEEEEENRKSENNRKEEEQKQKIIVISPFV